MFERSGYHFFTFRNVDVSVSPWYMILMAFFALGPLRAGGMQGMALVQGILLILVITFSLLVHEFGHAFASKKYGLQPSVLLHGFGGLCFHQPASTDARDAFIVFAGPGLQLILGGLALGFEWFVLPQLGLGATALTLVGTITYYMVRISIGWALINLLLPIWPLDGGQLFHLILRRFMPEARAQELALKASLFVLVPVGIICLVYFKLFFVALLALFLFMNNLNALKSGQSLVARKAAVRASDFQQELFAEAEEAMAQGDCREAYRLCHQLRSTGELPTKMLDRVWEILALTSIEMGRLDEARSYLKRAPESAALAQARERLQAENA